ncbi:MAG: DUF2231 domain-containing protein [Pseudomonadota bacterium]
MIDSVYHFLEGIGFTHPLHPALTHVPMGMVMGGFTFVLVYAILKKPEFLTTATYCMGLGFLGIFPTVLLGVMDWQYRFSGVWHPLIIAKMVFALGLTVMMLVAIKVSLGHTIKPVKLVGIYFACLVLAVGLGFMGGQLQYG